MKELKLYWLEIEICVLEYNFIINKVIQAETWGDAMKIANDFMKDYYGQGEPWDKDNEDVIRYVFNGGCPIVTLLVLEQIGKERLLERMFERSLIKE